MGKVNGQGFVVVSPTMKRPVESACLGNAIVGVARWVSYEPECELRGLDYSLKPHRSLVRLFDSYPKSNMRLSAFLGIRNDLEPMYSQGFRASAWYAQIPFSATSVWDNVKRFRRDCGEHVTALPFSSESLSDFNATLEFIVDELRAAGGRIQRTSLFAIEFDEARERLLLDLINGSSANSSFFYLMANFPFNLEDSKRLTRLYRNSLIHRNELSIENLDAWLNNYLIEKTLA